VILLENFIFLQRILCVRIIRLYNTLTFLSMPLLIIGAVVLDGSRSQRHDCSIAGFNIDFRRKKQGHTEREKGQTTRDI
jgi:hypothetical protein